MNIILHLSINSGIVGIYYRYSYKVKRSTKLYLKHNFFCYKNFQFSKSISKTFNATIKNTIHNKYKYNVGPKIYNFIILLHIIIKIWCYV